MSDNPPSRLYKPKNPRPWPRRIFLAILGLLVLLLAARLIAGWVMDAKLSGRVESLRAAGEPVTFADFPLAPVSPDNNAMPLYEEAFVALDALDDAPIFRAERDNATNVPPEAARSLELLRQAALLPGCRPSVELRGVITVDTALCLDHLAQSNRGGRLLKLACEAEIRTGRADDAARDVEAMLRLTRAQGNPLLITLLVQAAQVESALADLRRVLDASEPSPSALAAVDSAVAQSWSDALLIDSLRGDRVYLLMAGREILDHPERVGQTPSAWDPLMRPFRVAALIRGLDNLGAWIDKVKAYRFMGSPLPLPGHFEMPQDLGQVDSLSSRMVEISNATTAESVLAFERIRARAGCARLAIALRLYRLEHGAYPDSLDALAPEFVPKLPRDPFSDGPFIYRKDASGFIVYSLGSNRADDHGVEVKGDPDKGDIVWKCSR